MKYFALQLLGTHEVSGLRALANDSEWSQPGIVLERTNERDTTNYGRLLHNYLKGYDFECDANSGVIRAMCFGVVKLELLVGLTTFPRWVSPIGGIRNPYLFDNGSERVEDIINFLRTIKVNTDVVSKEARTKRKSATKKS